MESAECGDILPTHLEHRVIVNFKRTVTTTVKEAFTPRPQSACTNVTILLVLDGQTYFLERLSAHIRKAHTGRVLGSWYMVVNERQLLDLDCRLVRARGFWFWRNFLLWL